MDNFITEITGTPFKFLLKLKSLTLKDNKIAAIGQGMLRTNSVLQTLFMPAPGAPLECKKLNGGIDYFGQHKTGLCTCSPAGSYEKFGPRAGGVECIAHKDMNARYTALRVASSWPAKRSARVEVKVGTLHDDDSYARPKMAGMVDLASDTFPLRSAGELVYTVAWTIDGSGTSGKNQKCLAQSLLDVSSDTGVIFFKPQCVGMYSVVLSVHDKRRIAKTIVTTPRLDSGLDEVVVQRWNIHSTAAASAAAATTTTQAATTQQASTAATPAAAACTPAKALPCTSAPNPTQPCPSPGPTTPAAKTAAKTTAPPTETAGAGASCTKACCQRQGWGSTSTKPPACPTVTCPSVTPTLVPAPVTTPTPRPQPQPQSQAPAATTAAVANTDNATNLANSSSPTPGGGGDHLGINCTCSAPSSTTPASPAPAAANALVNTPTGTPAPAVCNEKNSTSSTGYIVVLVLLVAVVAGLGGALWKQHQALVEAEGKYPRESTYAQPAAPANGASAGGGTGTGAPRVELTEEDGSSVPAPLFSSNVRRETNFDMGADPMPGYTPVQQPTAVVSNDQFNTQYKQRAGAGGAGGAQPGGAGAGSGSGPPAPISLLANGKIRTPSFKRTNPAYSAEGQDVLVRRRGDSTGAGRDAAGMRRTPTLQKSPGGVQQHARTTVRFPSARGRPGQEVVQAGGVQPTSPGVHETPSLQAVGNASLAAVKIENQYDHNFQAFASSLSADFTGGAPGTRISSMSTRSGELSSYSDESHSSFFAPASSSSSTVGNYGNAEGVVRNSSDQDYQDPPMPSSPGAGSVGRSISDL